MTIAHDITKEALELHRMFLDNDPSGVRLELAYAKLSRTNLTGAQLSDAFLCNADFDSSDLSGVDLSAAQLYKAYFNKTNLTGAKLAYADLRSANFMDANLIGVDLRNADLRSANLLRANLRKINLTGAFLSAATLVGTDLVDANLCCANLRGADLSGSNATRANLSDAFLRNAYLSYANLYGANLSGADLFGANLSDVNLKYANLSDADLRMTTLPYDPPAVKNIYFKILQCIDPKAIDPKINWRQTNYHRDITSPFLGGWAITLAGRVGTQLAIMIGSNAAAALIFAVSYPQHRVPNFFVSDAEALEMVKSRALAEYQAGAGLPVGET